MRRHLLVLIAVLLPALATLAAAEPAATEPFARGRIVDGITCGSSPVQSYALYLPSRYEPGKHLPLLLVFDARRRGAAIAESFREPAEKYGWIIASSNDTRSDETWEPNEIAIRAMLPDVLRRFAPDPHRIYATGFSGGAMVAWWLAQKTTGIAGIIGCSGRLADPKDADHIAFDWFGTAGTLDFNYSETRIIDTKLAANRAVAHRAEFFDGVHQWAPKELLAEAIGWLELQAMRRGTRARDEALIRERYDADVAAAKALDAQPLAQLRRYEAIARTFDGLLPLDGVRATIGVLSAKPEIARALGDERRDDDFEASSRAKMPGAINAFVHADPPLPATVLAHELDLDHLHALAAEQTSRGLTARRLLETIAAQVSNRLPRDLMARREYGLAAAIFDVACNIHPARFDLHYNRACALAQARRRREALNALERAVAAGFRDADHAAGDPDLAPLHGDPRFAGLVARMRL
jgi:dienelactone hydrolase